MPTSTTTAPLLVADEAVRRADGRIARRLTWISAVALPQPIAA